MPVTAYPFDIDALTDHRKRTRRELINDGSKRIKKKIAVLGGSTTNDFIKTLEVFLNITDSGRMLCLKIPS